MFISAIVVAAGKGLRLRSKVSKAVIKINKKPLIAYSLGVLKACREIKEIILVCNRANRGRLKAFAKKTVLGGKLRRDSVNNGLKAVDPQADLILIHDAARPFIDKTIVLKAINTARRYGAAVVGVPVKNTIKKLIADNSELIVKETIDRKRLWEIQTPQVFKKEIIFKAYQRFSKSPATDEAMLVEKLGRKVYIVRGSYHNIKITTPEDLVIAGAIAKRWKNA